MSKAPITNQSGADLRLGAVHDCECSVHSGFVRIADLSADKLSVYLGIFTPAPENLSSLKSMLCWLAAFPTLTTTADVLSSKAITDGRKTSRKRQWAYPNICIRMMSPYDNPRVANTEDDVPLVNNA